MRRILDAGVSVYLRSLQLTNYRNFRRLALTLEDGPSVIQGENAQGKTNLFEAIELLATTKSARAGSDRELINWGALSAVGNSTPLAEPFARITAVTARERTETHADVLLRLTDAVDDGGNPSVSKTFKLNGLPRRALEFVGAINVVAFSPEDVTLVAGPPSGRRRYLDVTNAQMSPRYLRTLQRYAKVVVQRNSLLRLARERGRADPSLQVWNEELANNGAVLIYERALTVRALSVLADRWFHDLGGWGQELSITYQPALGDSHLPARLSSKDSDEELAEVKSLFTEALARMAPRERGAGVSLVGPHRDELRFLVDGVDLHVYGSRGQQRLAALALKLAEVDVLRERVGSRPILLLDDVLSELDQPKQASVLRTALSMGQSLITVTSLDQLRGNALSHACIYHLEAGAIERRSRGTQPSDGEEDEP